MEKHGAREDAKARDTLPVKPGKRVHFFSSKARECRKPVRESIGSCVYSSVILTTRKGKGDTFQGQQT